MDALCLAAGKGTRFGRLGAYLQKCMYPVGLRPFLAYSVENLLASGAVRPGRDRLTLIIGHHGEQVRAYFGREVDGLEVGYLEQPDPRGTGHALALAHAELAPDAPLLIWLADGYVPAAWFAGLAAHENEAAMVLAPGHEDENPSVRIDVDGARIVRAFHGRGPRFDVGVWKLPPAVLGDMTDEAAGGEIRMLPNLQRMIESGLEVGYVDADEWLHLGGTAPTPEANVARVEARVRELHGLPAVRSERRSA
ncbi:MAG: NTP transferase domain-containing protein [Deinococcus-Thermus bacterium]|nr:NTP transferase domain-containing protein [Deinococcota bacterium]